MQQQARGLARGIDKGHAAQRGRIENTVLNAFAVFINNLPENNLGIGEKRVALSLGKQVALTARLPEGGLPPEVERALREALPQLVRKAKKGEDSEPKSRGATPGGKDADIAALEQHLADILGLKVEIADSGDGPGMLALRYSTLDQLDMLCQRLSGERI